MKKPNPEFIIINKKTKESQVINALDKHHARAIGERIFNTDTKNIKIKKL